MGRICGISQQCLGDPRVVGRRALWRGERRDLTVKGERLDCMATRVDENGFGGEARNKGEKAAHHEGRHVVEDA